MSTPICEKAVEGDGRGLSSDLLVAAVGIAWGHSQRLVLCETHARRCALVLALGTQGKRASWPLLLTVDGCLSDRPSVDRLVDSTKLSLINHVEAVNNVETPLPWAASPAHSPDMG